MDELRPYRSYVSYMDRSREYYAAQGLYEAICMASLWRCALSILTKASVRLPDRIGDDSGKTEIPGLYCRYADGAGFIYGADEPAADAPFHG